MGATPGNYNIKKTHEIKNVLTLDKTEHAFTNY